jgi:hypothetical protein
MRLKTVPLLVLAALMLAAVSAAPASAAARSDTTWVCLPSETPNPCHDSLDTTIKTPNAGSKEVEPPFAKHPKIDCFYVYPTVNDQTGPNADGTVGPQERSIANYQAARFSRRCRVYAPAYRQLTLPALFAGTVTDAATKLAYSDVKKAFRDYIAHYNHGRGFVLIGHSQGSFMLRALVRDLIDGHPKLRRQMVSAILLGGNVTVKKGSDRGGDFQNVPACHSQTQLHCVIAYSTYDEPPPDDALFGRVGSGLGGPLGLPTGDDLKVLCTNPGALGGGTGKLRTLVRTEPFQGAIQGGLVIMYGGVLPVAPTPWLQPAGYYSSQCRTHHGIHVLHVDARAGAQDLNPSPDATWGLHLADVNIALGQLVGTVKHEADAYVRRTR